MAKTLTLEEIQTSYDWEEVFGEGTGGNTDRQVSSIPAEPQAHNGLVLRSDIVEVIAAVNGENDGDEWVGVFLLNDGRYLVAEGGCDYTGWDCQAGNALIVGSSRQQIVTLGLTEEQRKRLDLHA